MDLKKFVALASPSGGGKTTLCLKLLKKYPLLTTLSISFTTRPPRGQEKHGVEYFFVSKEEFQTLIKDNALAEWAEVHGNYYGTSKAFLEGERGKGKIVLLDIDVQGVASLKRAYSQETLSVFIQPPSFAELEARLRARKTESEEKIQQRLLNAKKEMQSASGFDYQIINHDLEIAFSELCTIFENETGAQ